jgi:LmbE family N-acetylglucosaminyl deacetylase
VLRLSALALTALFCLGAAAQPVPLPAAPDSLVEPRPLVVMNLAGHPDDEDGQTLTYYRHAQNAVAYSVIYTRGEGGQNEIGPDLYEKLGAIRTEETERAARHLGTQTFFLNFEDFGFSKSAEETFERWGGREAVTARLVYLVRKLKPDVIFTNHDTLTVGPRLQHGHHQVVGITAMDAMRLAADSTFAPEQLEEEDVDLWQPSRLFLRQWRFTQDAVDAKGEVERVAVPVSETDPSLGAGYNLRASNALHEHASQGMGQFASRFLRGSTYFVPLARAEGDPPIAAEDLAANLPPNRAARHGTRYLVDAGRLPRLAGVTVSDSVVVPGQEVAVSFDAAPLGIRRLQIVVSGAVDTMFYRAARPGSAASFRLSIPAGVTPTLPKHVRQYDRYESSPPLLVSVYEAAEDPRTTPPRAAAYLPVEIAPALTVESPRPVVRLRGGANVLPLEVRVYDPEVERIALNVAVTHDERGEIVALKQTEITPRGDAQAGGFADSAFTQSLPLSLPGSLEEGSYSIALTALAQPTSAPGRYASLLDLPPPPGHGEDAPEVDADASLATLTIAARAFDVDVAPGLKVGLVESYDETLAKALEQLGVDYVKLTPEHLSAPLGQSALDTLHTVLVDIRAYLVREDLRQNNAKLLEWAEGGGHMVVSYQKTFEWNADQRDPFVEGQTNGETYPEGFAPYPLVLARDRVTREDAPVTLLLPEHPLVTTPNRLGPEAWDGWIQERGLYFPETYDERYAELFAMNDPGEDPLPSSTLFAEVGAGSYLFTALGWYRQLGVFHPGGYAAFANMISYPLVAE